MAKILVFQHVAFELLGTLDPIFKSYGFRIRYVNFGRDPGAEPSLKGYRGLVVLGGPMNVGQVDRHPHLVTEERLIREAIDGGMPVLGICLGSQLIAKALGAEVRPNGHTEIGWYDVTPTSEGRSDPLMSQFDGTERIFQWHGQTFDIPEGAVHLASSPTCANQAFRYGNHVYGLQFHLEVDEGLIERWLSVPDNQEQLREVAGEIDPEEIRRETRQRIAAAKELSDRTFVEFVRLFGDKYRRMKVPHR